MFLSINLFLGSRKETATNHDENSSKLEALLLSLENPFFFAKTIRSRNELVCENEMSYIIASLANF